MTNILVNKRVQSLILIVVVALAALAGLLVLMNWLAGPDSLTEVQPPATTPAAQAKPNPSTPAATVVTAEAIVATVNDTNISRQSWQKATQLDAVMSKLARQPAPTAEETLDRLVNEILVVNAAPDIAAVTDADVAARIEALTAAWNVSEPALDGALQAAKLSRDDLHARVAELLKVEAALGQLSLQQEDVNAWLARARTAAEIGVYRSLAADAPPTPAPAVAAQQPAAEPAQPASEPLPPPDAPVGPNPANAAPDFSLPLLEAGSINLSQLRGKPTIINFWATWCPPCRRELPALQAAFEAYGDRIGFVAVDVKESPQQVSSFVKELGLTFPVALDADGAVSDVAYKVRGIPTTIFVDATGVIAARHVGPLEAADIDAYLAPLLEPVVASVEMPNAGAGSAALTMLGAGNDSRATPPAPDSGLEFAPDFSLKSATGETVSLQDYRGQSSVVLVFYRGHT